MDTTEVVRDFYNHGVQYEWERLERHPIEFAAKKVYEFSGFYGNGNIKKG